MIPPRNSRHILLLGLAATVVVATAAPRTARAQSIAPLGVTVRTLEYGPWSDAVATIERDPSSQGRALHVNVIDNATNAALACAHYVVALDVVANGTFTVGSCDPHTQATVLIVTDRRGLFADPDHDGSPLAPRISILSRVGGVQLEQLAPPASAGSTSTVAGATSSGDNAPPAASVDGTPATPTAPPLEPPAPWQTASASVPIQQTACASWDVRGCDDLPRPAGAHHPTGSISATIATWRRGCEHGDRSACTQLGWAQAHGTGLAVDYAGAMASFQRACALHVATACTDVGWMLAHALGASLDGRAALAHYNEGCSLGDANGCANAGLIYEAGLEGQRDSVAAVQVYRRGCEAGYQRACAYLGRMYMRGEGVVQDAAAAVRLFETACTHGEHEGCALLGWSQLEGTGTTRDSAHGVQLLDAACSSQQLDACVMLAGAYEHGVGVAADPARAQQLRQQACTAGYTAACTPAASP